MVNDLLNAKWETMEELVKDYEEQVEGGASGTLRADRLRRQRWRIQHGDRGMGGGDPIAPAANAPHTQPGLLAVSFYADDADSTTTDASPLDFSQASARPDADDTEDEEESREAELAVGAFTLHSSAGPTETAETADPVPSPPMGDTASDLNPSARQDDVDDRMSVDKGATH